LQTFALSSKCVWFAAKLNLAATGKPTTTRYPTLFQKQPQKGGYVLFGLSIWKSIISNCGFCLVSLFELH
ncbi:hypothetical protein T4B_7332, partial [Trichinella pseudospiralis]